MGLHYEVLRYIFCLMVDDAYWKWASINFSGHWTGYLCVATKLGSNVCGMN